MTLQNEQNITTSTTKNIFNIILLTVIVIILIIPYIKYIIFPIAISLFLTVLFDPIIIWFESKGLKRVAGIFFVIVLVIGCSIFFIYLFGSLVTSELKFIQELNDPSLFISAITQLPFEKMNIVIQKLGTNFHSIFVHLVNKSTHIFPSHVSLFLLLIFIPVSTYLLLKDGHYLKKKFVQLLPNRYFEMVLDLINRIDLKLSQWIKQQLFVAMSIACLAILALYLLNISHFIMNGIIVGLAHLIPFYGPFLGATIVITITLIETGSLKLALAIIIALATIKLLYNLLLSKMITSNSINLHPLIIIIMIFTGSFLWGLIGILFIVPITTIVALLCKEIFERLRDYSISS